ncbi:PIN domain-containing protein [Pseudomonadota bacterium]
MKTFVDTNILVYAYDRGAGNKHEKALSLIEQLWQKGNGILSTQVLQEFYVNVRRKAQRPVTVEQARALIADYLAWDPVVNDGAIIMEAIDIESRYQLSFWDSLIVAAAQKSGASIIYSENFTHGQKFGSVEVQNPLLDC